MAKFTVDTHLFRELGALLVGRDSTALIELIKNAYDADAKRVTVYGEGLENTSKGFIRIVDDGVGMTPELFEEGFLRIASRGKEQGDRRSIKFERRYTGAKGIGRLAAHKLARYLTVTSNPDPEYRGGSQKGIEAKIDWDRVEACETLEELDNQDPPAISVAERKTTSHSTFGTTITLSKLRTRWPLRERIRFIEEIQTFYPPKVLLELPKGIVKHRTLFQTPTIVDAGSKVAPFNTRLEGEFSPSDDYWIALAQAAGWIIEIDASAIEQRVEYNILPTQRFLHDPDKDAQIGATRIRTKHPAPESKMSLQARILVKEGSSGSRKMKDWAGNAYGIRVFLEGFRVLPYGEKRNDWLSLDFDYARRARGSQGFEDTEPEEEADSGFDRDAGLVFLPNRSYFGAVFLTQTGAPFLQMLVNREGFVPDANYEALVQIVRTGIDLATRTRAAASRPSREKRKQERAQSRERPGITSNTPLRTVVAEAKTLVTRAKEHVAGGNIGQAKASIETAESAFAELSERLIEESAMMRVLASVGTQMAAFIHEINGLLGLTTTIEKSLERVQRTEGLSRNARSQIGEVRQSLGDLRRALERQAAYLVDVVTPDARRRRMRLEISDRFEAAMRLVQHVAEQRRIAIKNDIPRGIKSPPMFPAELTTVFSNLLTNAVKAAGEDGKISATATREKDGRLFISIQNTGVAVNLAEGERWFRPFESTTTKVDTVLGQGMGLGLPITRSILEQYGADIRFAKPSPSFSTSIEIRFPAE